MVIGVVYFMKHSDSMQGSGTNWNMEYNQRISLLLQDIRLSDDVSPAPS